MHRKASQTKEEAVKFILKKNPNYKDCTAKDLLINKDGRSPKALVSDLRNRKSAIEKGKKDEVKDDDRDGDDDEDGDDEEGEEEEPQEKDDICDDFFGSMQMDVAIRSHLRPQQCLKTFVLLKKLLGEVPVHVMVAPDQVQMYKKEFHGFAPCIKAGELGATKQVDKIFKTFGVPGAQLGVLRVPVSGSV